MAIDGVRVLVREVKVSEMFEGSESVSWSIGREDGR